MQLRFLVILLCGLLSTGLALARVNVNTASLEELDALPGIGPARAQAIIDYRSQHGPFRSGKDLENVPRLPKNVIDKLRGELSYGAGESRSMAAPAAASGRNAESRPPASVTPATRPPVQPAVTAGPARPAPPVQPPGGAHPAVPGAVDAPTAPARPALPAGKPAAPAAPSAAVPAMPARPAAPAQPANTNAAPAVPGEAAGKAGAAHDPVSPAVPATPARPPAPARPAQPVSR